MSTDHEDIAARWHGRVPIIIGSIGHPHIDPAATPLTDAVAKHCQRLKDSYKGSPFVVLSALAEGPDRLIAEKATTILGADLIAVLPLPPEEYERDFTNEASKAQFRELLQSAAAVKIAHIPENDVTWKTSADARNRQYAKAGAIITDHAQILFAICDDKPTDHAGDTLHQVDWFKEGRSPKDFCPYEFRYISPLRPCEPRRIIEINPSTAQVDITDYPAKSGRLTRSEIEVILSRIKRYNKDVIGNLPLIAHNKGLAQKAPDPASFAIINESYRAGDALAVKFGTIVRRSDVHLYRLALVAVVAFNLISNTPFAPGLYLILTAIMAALTLRVREMDLDTRFMEYRCLAESLRILFFCRSGGVARPVWLACLTRQTGVVLWLRQAVRAIEFCQDAKEPALTPQAAIQNGGLAFAKRAWVDGQRTWFADKYEAHLKQHKLWSWIIYGAFGASFITAIILTALTLIHDASGQYYWNSLVEKDHRGDWWQVALSLFTAGAIAARGYLDRRAHLEIAKQYASQGRIFATASAMLDEAAAPHTQSDWNAEEILSKLGREAMQEQAEWLWLRHSRPFEIPTN